MKNRYTRRAASWASWHRGRSASTGANAGDVQVLARATGRGEGAVRPAVPSPSGRMRSTGDEESAAAFMARRGDEVRAGDPLSNRNLSHVDFSVALDGPGPVLVGAMDAARSVGR